jgi:hypothetical protein
VIFLLNDVILDFDPRSLVPPLEAGRFEALSFSAVIDLGRELFSEDPLIHRNSPERARRLALLLSMKQPDINAALFVAPHHHCPPEQVATRFCNISIDVMAELRAKNARGSLDAVTADREVWRRLAA